MVKKMKIKGSNNTQISGGASIYNINIKSVKAAKVFAKTLMSASDNISIELVEFKKTSPQKSNIPVSTLFDFLEPILLPLFKKNLIQKCT